MAIITICAGIHHSVYDCIQRSEISGEAYHIILSASPMSIYSGFPTRKDETKYNDLLSRLILMMQQHLLQTIQGELPQKKVLAYTKVITRMKDYQEHKYLPPKFADLLQPLCQLIGLDFNSTLVQRQTTHMQERVQLTAEKGKGLPQSAKKERVTSKLASCLQNLESKHIKKGSLFEQQRETQLKSTSHLKQRKFNIHAGESPGVQVGPTYEEQQLSRASTTKHAMGSQPIILSSKIKNSLRYRAFPLLNEVQEHMHKRNTPLREEMRKRIKTKSEHSQD